MKVLVIVCFIALHSAVGKKLPAYLKELTCSRQDANYAECLKTQMERARPYFIKGIPELELPPMDPFELPVVSVNRTLNELVSINAILKNVKVVGLGNTIVEDFKADPEKLTGEIRCTIPWASMEMEYDVKGQLLVIPLQSKGFFEGNFTDTKVYAKGSLKPYERDGETYARVDKFHLKSIVGDGRVKLTAKNPQLQFGADLISNFFNENTRAVLDAVNPIYVDFMKELYTAVSNQILADIPVSEYFSD